MKTLIEKLTPIQTLSAIIIGLVTGAFGLIYAYWQFSDLFTSHGLRFNYWNGASNVAI